MAAHNKILEQITTRCNAMNWSRYRLAKEADIPYSSLNNMYKRNTIPSIPTLEKICAGMNVSLSDFFKDIEADDGSLSVVLTAEEQKIFADINSLSKVKQSLLFAYMDGLLEEG